MFTEFIKDKHKHALEAKEKVVNSIVSRPIIFIIFFASNMAAAFIPLYAKELYVPIWGIPKEAVIALPISIEVLCCALAAFAGGHIIEKIGLRITGIVGTICFFIGLLMCGIAPDVRMLIIGNGISGIGSGLVLIVVNTFIAAIEDEDERNRGFTYYNAAFLGGLNSGVVIGSLLVNWMSYRTVFYIASIISIGTAYFVVKYMDEPPSKQIEEDGEEQQSSNEIIAFMKFYLIQRFLYYSYARWCHILSVVITCIISFQSMGLNMGLVKPISVRHF